jgi:hypothetical protein
VVFFDGQKETFYKKRHRMQGQPGESEVSEAIAKGANRRGLTTADIKIWTEVYDNCDVGKNEGIPAEQRTLF